MGTFKQFEDIEAWQKARELTRGVYKGSRSGPCARDFSLRDQVRRAATSVMSNIAEGFERGGNAEFLQFPAVARGSAAEVQSLLCVAFDEEYISRAQFNDLKSLALSTRRLISGLSAYLRRSSMKGEKYKRARARWTAREPGTGHRERGDVRCRRT